MTTFKGKVDTKGRVSIPIIYRETEDIRTGDIVEIRLEVIKRKRETPKQ